MVRGRKQRIQKTKNGMTPSSPSSKKLSTNNLNVNDLFDTQDSDFNSPKRKEFKIGTGVLVENCVGKQTSEKRPATRSTRKINEYFAKLPGNGLIQVQNGRDASHSHSSDDSNDSNDDDSSETKIVTTENVSPNSETHTMQKSQQSKTIMNGPILKHEGQIANANLFLQEPVLKLEFDKNEAVLLNGNGHVSTIKTSFLSTEINTKFQTLPPTEYINKVLNVNGSHHDEREVLSNDEDILLSSDDANNLIMSPLHVYGNKRRKPTTPHRMILCPSPVKCSPSIQKQNAETIIKASKVKKHGKTKLTFASENCVHQDHDYDIKKVPEEKMVKTASTKSDGNKKVTEFFTVRRSVRKTKKEVQEERMRTIEQAILEGREDGLKVQEFPNKGRGVITTRNFQRGEFVIEYIGDLISMAEANERELKYAADDNTGCYMYYFKHNEQQYCIDATAETGKLGRLVNHSRNGNLVTKTVMIGKRPHLVLIAKDDLSIGVELTYDYGDRSKESLQHHPWLAY